MRKYIGIFLLMVGLSASDSECLLVPMALIVAGWLLVRKEVSE